LTLNGCDLAALHLQEPLGLHYHEAHGLQASDREAAKNLPMKDLEEIEQREVEGPEEAQGQQEVVGVLRRNL
jgi:hypothetical protein